MIKLKIFTEGMRCTVEQNPRYKMLKCPGLLERYATTHEVRIPTRRIAGWKMAQSGVFLEVSGSKEKSLPLIVRDAKETEDILQMLQEVNRPQR